MHGLRARTIALPGSQPRCGDLRTKVAPASCEVLVHFKWNGAPPLVFGQLAEVDVDGAPGLVPQAATAACFRESVGR